MNVAKYLLQYLSPKVIFAIDLVVSFLSSWLVLLFLNFFAEPGSYTDLFSIWYLAGSLVFTVLSMLLFNTAGIVIRHIGISDIFAYIKCVFVKEAALLILIFLAYAFNKTVIACIFFDGLFTFGGIVFVRMMMLLLYGYYKSRYGNSENCSNVLIFGTSDKAVASIKRFENSKQYDIVGLLSRNSADRNLKIERIPVYVFDSEDEFKDIVSSVSANTVLFTNDDEVRAEKDGIMSYLPQSNVKAMVIPPVNDIGSDPYSSKQVRNVKIEDLLGRPEIKISMDEIKRTFNGKVVMVTGAAGSIGSELCRQLAVIGVKQLILFDNAETPMHNIMLELREKYPDLNFSPVVGSVRHKDRLDFVFRTWRPQVIFHAAAYKHVPMMEENPCEAVFANVHGTRLVADKCIEYGVEKMVMISTDKAVNPTNVMGCSKRIAEIYVQSLGLAISQGKVEGKTKFITTRFGNVLGSNGSVIPHFTQQILNGGPVTVTSPEITRFFMTIPEACRLVMEAATISTGNQILVFDMGEPVKILDLARKMIQLAGLKEGEDIKIVFTGLRPGEKLYEEVLSNEENTLPTSHDRIRIAKVREYDYAEVLSIINDLAEMSKAVDVRSMIKLMKTFVPEYKSKNSIFEQFDDIKG